MTELKVKPDVARMFEGLRIASDEEIARYEAREKHAARSQRLASCGIDVTDEERALVLGGRLRKTKPIEIVQKWHSTAPVAGCTLASLEGASNGILVLAGGMGTGKTISAAWWLSHAPGRYLSIIDLAVMYDRKERSLGRAADEASASWEALERVDHLVIDELGQELDKHADNVRLAWGRIVDKRRSKKRRTLVLSNLSAVDFVRRHQTGVYDARTGDRLVEHGTITEVSGDSMRGRKATA